jgi:hypothetical protein
MKKNNIPGNKLKALINGENAINKDNIKDYYPNLNDIKNRVVRLTVWFQNDDCEEMEFIYSPFCFNGDCEARAAAFIEDWCKEMTRHYLQIQSYQVDFGVIWKDGRKQIGGMSLFKKKVPANKIYVITQRQEGKWMSMDEAKQFQQTQVKKYQGRPALRIIDEETMYEDEIDLAKSFNAAVEKGVMDEYPNGNRTN